MWSYYGSKTNVVHLYPKPLYNSIVEPFAGSARYALRYFENDVLLVDKYKIIIDIWLWLQKCSEKDITSLPKLLKYQSLDDFKFDCEEAKNFMGFIIAFGMSTPTMKATKHVEYRPNFINFNLKRVASQLFKIKHWVIQHGNYEDIENKPATWFIDPPYQFGGKHYVHGNKSINFEALRAWCECRCGQSIVCESSDADWMDFKLLADNKSGRGKFRTEVIWTNVNTSFGAIQQKLLL